MNTEIKTRIKHREAFVIFAPGKGFIKNKNKDYTDDFNHARLFGKDNHAANSIAMSNLKDKALVIPVNITLDPKQIFTKVLKR